jgi:hypothetical protein
MKRAKKMKRHMGLKDQRELFHNYYTVQIPYTAHGRTE